MFDLARDLKADRLIDYVAELKERQEELEDLVNGLSERVVVLEGQVAALTSGQKDN
jgi:hypothetical protein